MEYQKQGRKQHHHQPVTTTVRLLFGRGAMVVKPAPMGQEFPVDFLVDTSHEVLERTARSYLDNLLHCHPNNPEYFKLPNGRKVPITATSVGFVLLYGVSSQHKLLALFSPEDAFTAVAFYLDDDWWAVEEILKTADPTRNGIIQVRSVGERLVLYTLNRLVYRTREMDAAEWTFLCHSPTEHAKLLWQDGEAVGFYSVKPTGSLCTSFVSLHYKLPVLDSMFVTRKCRGQRLGLLMLQDFTRSFTDDQLGLKYPLPPAMCRVVERYLQQYPDELDLLWEVQAPGDPYQRVNVWKKLQSTPIPQQSKSQCDIHTLINAPENCTDIADTPVERQSVAIQTSAEEVMQAHAPPSNDGEQLLQSDADEELPGDDIEKQSPSSNEESLISNGADDEVTAEDTGDLPTEDKEVVVKDDETPTLVEDEEQLPTDDNKELTPLADDTENEPPIKNVAEEMSSEDEEEEEVHMEAEEEEEPPVSEVAALTENDEGPAAAPGVETDHVEGDCVQGDTSNAAMDASGADEAAAEQDNGENKQVVSTQSSQTLANENIDTSVAANVPPPTAEQPQRDGALSYTEEDPTQTETSEADAEEQISITEEEQVANEATPTNTDAASDTPIKENIVKKKAKAGEMSSPVVALQKPNTRNKFKNTRSSKKRGMLMSD
ncbi:unnamed protein product [Lampetra fluviatilis]